jgi:hypothetical protein
MSVVLEGFNYWSHKDLTSPKTTDFAQPASEVMLQTVAERLRERNFEAIIVATGKSKTLEDIGVFAELMGSDRYDFVRKRTSKMDRKTQAREIRKLGAAPDVMLGSVQALTEAGQLVVAPRVAARSGRMRREPEP